jgi:hypothetical protein
MSNFEKSMSEIFDVEPKQQTLPVVEQKTLPIVETKFGTPARLEQDLDQDYEESRKTLKELVKKGNDAIDHLMAIATDTEHPRAFEVVATLIKNTAEANEKLMTMQKAVRDMKNIKQKDGGVNVDKAIFVGSTAELNKLLKGRKDADTE